MNQGSEHCTSQEYYLLLDGRLEGSERSRVQDHLASCTRCRRVFQALSSIDESLRRLPLERTSPDFTRRVMSRVLRTRTPFAFLLLEHAASILGLLVVLGIMVSVFVATGVIDTTQVTQSQSIVSEMWGTVASAIHSWSVWLAGRFSPLQGNSALGIMVVATIVVAVIAGVDRVVGRRFIQKT